MSQVQAPPLDPATPDPHGKVTYEEFLAGDWGTNHVEWVDGDVVMMAAVSDEHTHVTVFLISALSAYVGAKKLGAILSEPYQMKLAAGNRGRAPDVMFVAETNLSRVTKTYLNGPADLAVEVVSPGSVATDRGAKFDEYEQGGVREYWLIDPLRNRRSSTSGVPRASSTRSPSTPAWCEVACWTGFG
jgi:Uma2 family endonuclease